MAQTGIRSYLNDNGYTNDQIGYSNGNVLLNGKNFYSATPQQTNDPTLGLVKGSTYGDPTALASALDKYRMTDYSAKAANTYDQYAGLASSKPAPVNAPSPFTYDAASDPQYQAALNLAKGNIQTSQNNTLANLVAHGQGDSSYSAGVTQGIANKEMANVSNNILPQLIEQAYKHYNDTNDMNFKVNQENYNRSNDYTKNVGGIADVYNNLAGQSETHYNSIQDALKKEADAQEQAKLGRIQLAKQLSDEYGIKVDPKMDPALVYKQVYGLKPLSRQDTEFEQGIKTGNLDVDRGQLDVSRKSQSNSATSTSNTNNNAKINQLFDAWKARGTAPAGLESLGVKEGTPYAGQEPKPSATDEKQDMQSQYVSGFDSLPPANRKTTLIKEKATIVKDLGIAGYNSIYDMYIDQYGDPYE